MPMLWMQTGRDEFAMIVGVKFLPDYPTNLCEVKLANGMDRFVDGNQVGEIRRWLEENAVKLDAALLERSTDAVR